jgi:hypothetical protein
MNLSSREETCLRYLSDKMEATGAQIGMEISGGGRSARGYAIIGNRVARGLMFRGLVLRLHDLSAWCISRAGRAAMAKSEAVRAAVAVVREIIVITEEGADVYPDRQ